MEQLRNYEKELDNIYSDMMWNIWNLLEKYGVDDDCCEVSNKFACRTLWWKDLCEVDLGDRTYKVDKVEISIRCGEPCLTITSEGLDYSVTEINGVFTILKAVHLYFSEGKTWKEEKTKILDKAIKFVEDGLLDHVFVEEIRLSLRCAEECRCPIDSDITDAIRDLLNEFGSDNDMPEDWFEDWYGFIDLEEIFWKLDIDYNED